MPCRFWPAHMVERIFCEAASLSSLSLSGSASSIRGIIFSQFCFITFPELLCTYWACTHTCIFCQHHPHEMVKDCSCEVWMRGGRGQRLEKKARSRNTLSLLLFSFKDGTRPAWNWARVRRCLTWESSFRMLSRNLWNVYNIFYCFPREKVIFTSFSKENVIEKRD